MARRADGDASRFASAHWHATRALTKIGFFFLLLSTVLSDEIPIRGADLTAVTTWRLQDLRDSDASGMNTPSLGPSFVLLAFRRLWSALAMQEFLCRCLRDFSRLAGWTTRTSGHSGRKSPHGLACSLIQGPWRFFTRSSGVHHGHAFLTDRRCT